MSRHRLPARTQCVRAGELGRFRPVPQRRTMPVGAAVDERLALVGLGGIDQAESALDVRMLEIGNLVDDAHLQ